MSKKTDFSKVGKRSKRIGADYERKVSRKLNEFVGRNIFRKTPGSGGFNKQGVVIAEQTFSGDLLCDDRDFIFSVEAKNRKSLSLTHIVTRIETSEFAPWWFQCCRDSCNVLRMPIMVFRVQDVDLVALPFECYNEHFDSYTTTNGFDDKVSFKVKERSEDETKARFHNVEATLPKPVIISLKRFMEQFPPELMFGDENKKNYKFDIHKYD